MRQRPAELSGIAGAIALLIGKLAGVDDPTTLAALGIVVGFIPAAVTWVVNTFSVHSGLPKRKR